MRIISGSLKGRIISAPSQFNVRPTTDLAKESLFNILQNSYDFEDIRVLDLFAGIGSISYEFASRGCTDITSVEKNFKHAAFIRAETTKLGISSISVVNTDVRLFLKTNKTTYDILFADPPYNLPWIESLPELLFASNCISPNTDVIIEHPSHVSYANNPNYIETRKYGKVHFSWFSLERSV